MTKYIDCDAAIKEICFNCSEKAICGGVCDDTDRLRAIPAADVRPVVVCADCKHNNACLTQAFVEDESRVPFDRNTFFCADGKRADMREENNG